MPAPAASERKVRVEGRPGGPHGAPRAARVSRQAPRGQIVLDVARTEAGRHYDFGPEVLPGVRVVRAEADHRSLALSLWTLPADVAEICGDAAVPATEALLAIDRDQAHELPAPGCPHRSLAVHREATRRPVVLRAVRLREPEAGAPRPASRCAVARAPRRSPPRRLRRGSRFSPIPGANAGRTRRPAEALVP